MKGAEDDVLSGITVKLNRLKTINKKHNRQKEKTRHILIYNFKVYLVVAFCFGSNNI